MTNYRNRTTEEMRRERLRAERERLKNKLCIYCGKDLEGKFIFCDEHWGIIKPTKVDKRIEM